MIIFAATITTISSLLISKLNKFHQYEFKLLIFVWKITNADTSEKYTVSLKFDFVSTVDNQVFPTL